VSILVHSLIILLVLIYIRLETCSIPYYSHFSRKFTLTILQGIKSKRYVYDALTQIISRLSISMLSRCGFEANSQHKSLPFFKEIHSNYFARNQRDMHMMLSPGLYHVCPLARYPGVVLRQTPKTSHCHFSRKFTPTISQGIKEICI
jgi:hypothetical protein